jgi:hypothetical protein
VKRTLALFLVMFALRAGAQETAPQDSSSTTMVPRIRMGGFAGVTFDRLTSTGHDAFENGEVDLYATAALNDEWSILGEAFAQRAGRSTDVEMQDRSLELNLERLYIGFNPSDRFRLELGQNHLGIVHWNEREHRGRFLQTPIDVPAIATRAEQGGAWPLHFIGLWASGRFGGTLGIRYGAGLGKARGSERDEIGPAFDSESTPGQLLTISVNPDAVPGLQFGGAEYTGDIPAPEGRMKEVDQTIFSSYNAQGLELRAEWAQMHHRRLADRRTFVTRGSYVLASWRLRGALQRVRPYVLLDQLDVAEGEAYLAGVRGQRAWAAGGRIDVWPWLAIKTDFRAQRAASQQRERLIRVQFSVSF